MVIADYHNADVKQKAKVVALYEYDGLGKKAIPPLCIDYIECQLAYRAGAENFSEISTAFTEKQTRLGYDIPENWTPELDPDKWEY